MVLHVGLRKEIFARKHTATHKPTSAHLHIVTMMTHINTHTHTHTHTHLLIVCGAPRAYFLAGQYFHLHRSTSLASRFLTQKEPIPRSEFTPALHLDILDADRLPNEAAFPRSSPGRLITMVKLKKNFKKIVSKNEK